MKPKIKLEMSDALFTASVMIYLISLALLMVFPGVFTGLWFLGILLTNNMAFSVIWTLVLCAILIAFTHLARKKNKSFIYAVRGILFIMIIANAFCVDWEPVSCIIFLAASIALFVMTFIMKTEKVLTNTITEEEAISIRNQNKCEMKHAIIGNLLGFTIVPVIILVLFGATAAPIAQANDEELKERYRVNMPSTIATEEQSKEFFDNIDNYQEPYNYIQNQWYVDTDLVTKMLKSNSNTNDYWMIGDTTDIVYHLFYDSWDNVADEHILIKNDYVYPKASTSKVAKICFANNFGHSYNKENAIIIDFTEEEINEIRGFTINNIYDEEKTEYFEEEYFEGEQTRDILWFFEGEDILYYECGKLVKTSDGKYYLRANSTYFNNLYVLSNEICEKIEIALGDNEF